MTDITGVALALGIAYAGYRLGFGIGVGIAAAGKVIGDAMLSRAELAELRKLRDSLNQ